MADSLRVQAAPSAPLEEYGERGFLGKTYDYFFDPRRYYSETVPRPGVGGGSPYFDVPRDDPGVAIRELKAKIDRGITEPTDRANWMTDPQFRWATSAKKTDKALLDSSKLDAYYQNLAVMYPPGNPLRERIPAEELRSLVAYEQNSEGFRDRIRSGYRPTGVLGSGSAVGAAATWMQSLGGMVHGAGKMAGNYAMGVDDAASRRDTVDAGKALGTFLSPLSPVTGETYHGALHDQAQESARNDAIIDRLGVWNAGHGYSPGAGGPSYSAKLRDALAWREVGAGQPDDTDTRLYEAGLPRYLSVPIGAVTDAVLNPVGSFQGLRPAVAAMKAGGWAPSLAQSSKFMNVVGLELLPEAGVRGVLAMAGAAGDPAETPPLMGIAPAPARQFPEDEWAEMEAADDELMAMKRAWMAKNAQR